VGVLMPTIFIPAPLRDLTQGKASVAVSASSVREAVESLETQFPGIKDRLCEGDRIRLNISVFVDGQVSNLKMREKLREDSEVHFVILISGGCCAK
jgi:molybdopterin synthase sulfur carrier subunit